MNINYSDTLIAVAEDCPVATGTVPVPRGGKKTIPVLQYEMMAGHPYKYTSADVLFEANMRHKGVSPAELKRRRRELWDEFFGKSQACLRASALPKKYGWGIHCDATGHVALYSMDSEDYRRYLKAKGVQVVKAMRSVRG